MNFNFVVGNPPYNRGLHLEISTKVFGKLSDDGEFIFVQPAAAFVNKNKKPTTKYKKYQEMVDTYETEYQQIGGSDFPGDMFLTDLGVTKITKKIDHSISVTYKDGSKYKTTRNGINYLGMPPEEFIGISKKLDVLKLSEPLLSDFTTATKGEPGWAISTIRGNVCQETGYYTSNYFSFFSPINYRNGLVTEDYRIVDNKHTKEQIYDYLEYKTTQMMHACYKWDQNPKHKIPYRPDLTEKELQELLGLTKEEIKAIDKYIPDYSAQPRNNFGRLVPHIIKNKRK